MAPISSERAHSLYGLQMHSRVVPVVPVVAVVDDDHRVLESLEELLESAGYVARLFASAAEFLESGELAAVHCLISDIRMPDIDGWELESTVFGRRPDLPIILITGDDLAQQEARSRRAGRRPRVLFRKPFNGQELLAEVRASIAGRAS
jgi:FixJ family two-component response regulator